MILPLLLACAGGPDDGAGPTGTGDGGAGTPLVLTAEPHAEHGSLLVVRWEQAGAGSTLLRFTLDEETHETTPVDRPAGAHQQLLAGLPYDTATTLSVVVDGQVLDTITARTDDLPDGVPEPELLVSMAQDWEPELRWLLLSVPPSGIGWGQPWWTLIVDRQGRVAWAREGAEDRITLHAQTSWEGTELLIDQNSFWGIFDGGEASTVERVKLDGTVQETIATPGLHHPFTALPDGGLAWGAVDGRDEHLVVRQADGTTTTLWSCKPFVEGLGSTATCASNTLRWSEERGTWLFSFYSFESVIELDGATGAPLRWFGQLPGSYTFDPEDSAFWWQHGVHWTEAGTLLVSTKKSEAGGETVVREYLAEEDSETLVLQWSFGEGQGIYGSEMGEAWRLPGGNTLHNYGSNARVREVSPDGTVVWDLDWGEDRYVGRMTALSSLEPLLP